MINNTGGTRDSYPQEIAKTVSDIPVFMSFAMKLTIALTP